MPNEPMTREQLTDWVALGGSTCISHKEAERLLAIWEERDRLREALIDQPCRCKCGSYGSGVEHLVVDKCSRCLALAGDKA